MNIYVSRQVCVCVCVCVCNQSCSSVILCGNISVLDITQNLLLNHFLFIPTMITGFIFGLHHFVWLSVVLTAADGHQLSRKQKLLFYFLANFTTDQQLETSLTLNALPHHTTQTVAPNRKIHAASITLI